MKLTFLKSAIIAVGIAIVGTTAYTATSISSFVAPLVMALGGTGSVLSPNSGGVIYSTGSQLAIGTPGSTGAPLLSNGTSPPGFGSDANLAYLDKAQAYSKGQATTPATIASCGGSIIPDGTTSNTYSCVLTSNLTLGNPTIMTPGYNLNFRFVQPVAGNGFTLSLGSAYKMPNGLAPTLSTAASAVDTLSCEVISSSEIDCGTLQASLGAPSTQAFVMNAPVTTATGVTLNYRTGCVSSPGAASNTIDASPNELKTTTGQHTCLIFDDHWNGTGTSSTTTSLNLGNWYAGNAICNNAGLGFNGTESCGALPGGAADGNLSENYPMTGWCYGSDGGCQDVNFYNAPYANGLPTPAGLTLTHNPLFRCTGTPCAPNTNGALAMAVKYYYPHSGNQTANQTAGNGTDGWCLNKNPLSLLDCAYVNWISGTITAGGLSGDPTGYPLNVNNNNALIPWTGGIMQWRMKLDDGVLNGAYGGMECDSVSTTAPYKGNVVNANFEFGYLTNAAGNGVPTATSIGNGLNNQPVQNGNGAGNTYVTTGDDGVGSGDTRNWHTYALEWTGPSGTNPYQWYYYVDGVPINVVTHAWDYVANQATVGSSQVGWQCKYSQGMSNPGSSQNNFHSLWTINPDGSAANPGPYYMYISDVNFYKKPGT